MFYHWICMHNLLLRFKHFWIRLHESFDSEGEAAAIDNVNKKIEWCSQNEDFGIKHIFNDDVFSANYEWIYVIMRTNFEIFSWIIYVCAYQQCLGVYLDLVMSNLESFARICICIYFYNISTIQIQNLYLCKTLPNVYDLQKIVLPICIMYSTLFRYSSFEVYLCSVCGGAAAASAVCSFNDKWCDSKSH